MKQYHCFSLRQAGYLMQRGFVLFEIQEDRNSNRKIYMFKDSLNLRGAIQEYMKQK